MTFFLPALVLLLLSGASAEVVTSFENQCDQFFAGKQPPIIPLKPAFKNICQTLNNVVFYATLYDTSNRIPVYSAYKFEGLKKCDRPTKWYIEPQLDNNNASENMALQCNDTCGTNQSRNEDYANLPGYNKGHLVPVYHASSQQCVEATFTLTNAAPQYSSFNQGYWRVTEKNIAEFLVINCKDYTKYIVTGVIPKKKEVKREYRVNVPSHFWTAYCCLDNNNICKFSEGYIGENKNIRPTQMVVSKLEKELAKLYHFENFQLFPNCTIKKIYKSASEKIQLN